MSPPIGGEEWPPRGARYPIPSGTAHIGVRFELIAVDPLEPLAGRLWDISAQGACVALPGFQQIKVPARARLVLVEPMSHERHQLEANLRWTLPLSHTTFVGLVFATGSLPRSSFLRTYMRGSWTDNVRRTDLRF